MTRREYHALGTHWSIMDSGIRLTSATQRRFNTLDLLGKERRVHGKTGIYKTLSRFLALESHTVNLQLP